MTQVDSNGNSFIEFDEFVNFMINRTVDHDTEDEILAAFKTITGDAVRGACGTC